MSVAVNGRPRYAAARTTHDRAQATRALRTSSRATSTSRRSATSPIVLQRHVADENSRSRYLVLYADERRLQLQPHDRATDRRFALIGPAYASRQPRTLRCSRRADRVDRRGEGLSLGAR